MSLYEKTVYPRLAEPIGADELVLDFTPTEEEIEFGTRSARQPASRLTLLVLLKLFQKLHRFRTLMRFRLPWSTICESN
jgi:hypothetical protein